MLSIPLWIFIAAFVLGILGIGIAYLLKDNKAILITLSTIGIVFIALGAGLGSYKLISGNTLRVVNAGARNIVNTDSMGDAYFKVKSGKSGDVGVFGPDGYWEDSKHVEAGGTVTLDAAVAKSGTYTVVLGKNLDSVGTVDEISNQSKKIKVTVISKDD